MSYELEIEKTYLLKYLPNDLSNTPFKDIEDLYLPKRAPRASLRIRKLGDFYLITKKEPVLGESASIQKEYSININTEEFIALKNCDCDRILKRRFYYKYNNKIAEIDIFLGELTGLALVDFEFSSKEEMNKFTMPDFCLADVSEEDFIAGGVLCKSSYDSLKSELNQYRYQALNIKI